MKAWLGSHFSSAVALVLFFAAVVPSQATQHRDPLLPQEAAQTQAADQATTTKAHANTKKNGSNPKAASKGKKHADGSSSASTGNTGDPRPHSGSGTGMK